MLPPELFASCTAGCAEVAPFNDEPYAHHWFGVVGIALLSPLSRVNELSGTALVALALSVGVVLLRPEAERGRASVASLDER